jgi:hypothetical protein
MVRCSGCRRPARRIDRVDEASAPPRLTAIVGSTGTPSLGGELAMSMRRRGASRESMR